MITLSDSAIFLVSIEAATDEHVVRCVLRGETAPPKATGRVLAALAARGVDLADIPTSPPRPMLNRSDEDGPIANGRMGPGDWGGPVHAHRGNNDD